MWTDQIPTLSIYSTLHGRQICLPPVLSYPHSHRPDKATKWLPYSITPGNVVSIAPKVAKLPMGAAIQTWRVATMIYPELRKTDQYIDFTIMTDIDTAVIISDVLAIRAKIGGGNLTEMVTL